MRKFDYTNYKALLQSFDYKQDSFNPHTEIFEQYVGIIEKFDPINDPPKKGKEKEYILNFIVPILQEYSRNFEAVLEIEEKADSVSINLITDVFIIIKDETDFKKIIFYSTVFAVERVDDKIKLKFYFST